MDYLKVSKIVFTVLAVSLVGGVLFSFWYTNYLKTIEPVEAPVVKKQTPKDAIDKKCIAGGCSGQLCVSEEDGKDLNTTCEWLEEYACYKDAKCEVQQTGECGWTMTEELTSCIANSASGFSQ